MSRCDDRMRQAEEQRQQMKQEFHPLCREYWQSIHEAASSVQPILQSVQEKLRMVHDDRLQSHRQGGSAGPHGPQTFSLRRRSMPWQSGNVLRVMSKAWSIGSP
jgi:hypothetical protein